MLCVSVTAYDNKAKRFTRVGATEETQKPPRPGSYTSDIMASLLEVCDLSPPQASYYKSKRVLDYIEPYCCVLYCDMLRCAVQCCDALCCCVLRERR